MAGICLDLKSKVPIYIQIRDQLRLQIATGELKPDVQMPPVRDLAGELLINPNTVQKAYHELEREGYIHTRRGMGTFVSERNETPLTSTDRGMMEEISREYVQKLIDLGLTPDEIRALIDSTLSS